MNRGKRVKKALTFKEKNSEDHFDDNDKVQGNDTYSYCVH